MNIQYGFAAMTQPKRQKGTPADVDPTTDAGDSQQTCNGQPMAKRRRVAPTEGADPATDAGDSQQTSKGLSEADVDAGLTAAAATPLEAEPTQETQRNKRTEKWECPAYVVRASDNALFVSVRQVCTWMSASVCSKAFPAEVKTRPAQAGVNVPEHIVGAMEGKFLAAFLEPK